MLINGPHPPSYQSSPIHAFEAKAVRSLAYPLYYRLRGVNPYRYEAHYRRAEQISKEDLGEIQLDKMRRLLGVALGQTSHYPDKLSSLALPEPKALNWNDWKRIPPLTRASLREAFPDQILNREYRGKKIFCSSGGSTGEPVQLYRTPEDLSRSEAIMRRAWSWTGYQVGERVVIISGNPILIARMKGLKRRLAKRATNHVFLAGSDLVEQELDEHLTYLAHFRPAIVRGYTMALVRLAERLLETGGASIRPRAVITTSETLFPTHRDVLQRAFQAPVFDEYGAGEIQSIAFECQAHQGLHVSADHVLLEFDTSEGPDEDGAYPILLTDLDNHVTPILRYAIGDRAVPAEGPCPCGRGLPRLKRVVGRTQDRVMTADGRMLLLEFFVVVFGKMRGIERFRIVQRVNNRIDVLIQANHNLISGDQEQLEKDIRQYVGGETDLSFEYLDRIPLSRSGKHKLVVRE